MEGTALPTLSPPEPESLSHTWTQVPVASRALWWYSAVRFLLLVTQMPHCPPCMPSLCPLSLTFSSSQARNIPVWLPSQDEPLPSSNCAIRVGDKGKWSQPEGQTEPGFCTQLFLPLL